MRVKNRRTLLGSWAAGLSLAAVLLGACSPSGSPSASQAPAANPPGTEILVESSPTPGAASPTAAPPGASATPLPAVTVPATPGSSPEAQTPAPTPSGSAQLSPATLPDPQTARWVPLDFSLSDVVGVANAGDGSGRLFALVRSGSIRVIQNGRLLGAPFLDITRQVTSRGTEQGLLGLAFHPHYAQNGFFYINYIDLNGNTVIARYHVSSDPNRADPASAQVVLRVQQPFPNHNGGSVVFGPDGYLYLGLGDGGSEGDPLLNGQNTQTLLGKLLRIDVDHGSPYSIPPDNPFVNGGGRPEIWAYGLRNPWRFSFDSATGDLYIGDVGQDKYEEIDYLPAGSRGGVNFGWSLREGFHPYKGVPPAGVTLTDPVFEYDHSQGCAVMGGYVYRGKALPAWQGVYLFGDYCSGNVWGLIREPDGKWVGKVMFQTGLAITTFGVDEQGEIYLADQRGGLYQFVAR